MEKRRRAALIGLLGAELVSTVGSRMSFLAIPWLVLVTTDDPTLVGVVAFAEALPYILAGIFGTPLADRFGVREVSIVTDLGSALVMGAVAAFGSADFTLLVVLIAVLGALRGVGDKSKRVLLPPVVEASGTPMARVTAVFSALNRTAMVIGAALAGVLIAWLGPVGAIWADAATFAGCAAVVAVLVRITREQNRPARAENESYLDSLKAGYAFLRGERLLRSLVGMMFVTNLFNQASAVVFIPLWVREHLDSPVALGWIGGAFALGAIAGGAAFAALVTRLPRYASLVVGYLVGGSPRFLVLAFSDDLRVALAVSFLSGVAMSSVNPTYGLLMFQRVPRAMQARVFGLTGAVTFGGIPLGGMVGAWSAETLGLDGGLLLAGAAYFAATLTPVVGWRMWRQIDDLKPGAAPAEPPLWQEYLSELGRRAGVLDTGPAVPVSVTLAYADGGWTVTARRGRRRLSRPAPISAAQALRHVAVLDVPAAAEAVAQVHRDDRRRLAVVRANLAAAESALAELRAAQWPGDQPGERPR
ncbi:MFS transporter [Catellatospora bangladeshensis]|uniref:Putative drug antiporter protein n=1 Tax=Catellatospora bangladeshensis TaxID=310355 RepID=A0A8J3NK56_9ACTN|nr:MFS transporter [Catellatospora bangladeshensis]GIF84100.1 putative drug antiporter protein precursor [Catellatospora bangladeshensis]